MENGNETSQTREQFYNTDFGATDSIGAMGIFRASIIVITVLFVYAGTVYTVHV